MKTRQHFFLNIYRITSGLVLHSFCLDCFSTFTHCLLLHHSEHLVSRGFSGFSSSSLLCLKSAQLLPVFLMECMCSEFLRVVIIISGRVIPPMSSPLFSLCGALFTIITSFITILHTNNILISIFLQSPDLVTTLFDQGSVLLRLLLSLLHLNYHHHQWQQCRNLMSLACHLSSPCFVPFSLLFLLPVQST